MMNMPPTHWISLLQYPYKIFEGYNSRYFYLPLGRAEFIVHTADDGKEIKDLGTHMIGNREYVMKVKSVIMNDNRGMTCCCSAINALGLTMPVTFMMADVRPSYMPGETVFFQGVGFLVDGNFSFYKSMEEAARSVGLSKLPNQILNGTQAIIIPGDGKKIYLSTIVSPVNGLAVYQGVPVRNSKEELPVYAIDVDTPIGPMTMVVPPAYFAKNPDAFSQLQAGNQLYVAGGFFLSGDVAEGEYKKGRVIDEEHLLMLIRQCKANGGFESLRKYLADDCRYIGHSISLIGPDAIIDKLSLTYAACLKDSKYINHDFIATVTQAKPSAKYREGKRCIASYVDGIAGYQALCFITLNDDSKISSIEFTYSNDYAFIIDSNSEYSGNTDLKLKWSPRFSVSEWMAYFTEWANGLPVNKEYLYSALSDSVIARMRGMEGSKMEAFMGISGCLDSLLSNKTKAGYTPFDIPIRLTLDQQKKICSVVIGTKR